MNKRVGLLLMMLTGLTTPAWADSNPAAAANQPLILDVRTREEYQQQHVQEAINIPYTEISHRIAAITMDHQTPIILYCRSGNRARTAEKTLRELGYTQIENKGGLEAMKDAGYRME